jgi:hypothetical protein
MTNIPPQIGDQTVVTNTDGSVVITTVTNVKVVTHYGFWPSPMGWSIIALFVADIAVVILLVLRKSDSN